MAFSTYDFCLGFWKFGFYVRFVYSQKGLDIPQLVGYLMAHLPIINLLFNGAFICYKSVLSYIYFDYPVLLL